MKKLIIFVTKYTVESFYSMQALITGASNTGVETEVIFNGTSVIAMTKQFYNKFPENDAENEYTKTITDAWNEGEYPDWLKIMTVAKQAGKLKVYLCQPCIEIFQKKYGQLDLLDIVDGKINGIEVFNNLKNEQDFLFVTV